MDEELISQVQDLGLSEKEARIYVASLMMGPSPVQKIADFAGIKRVTTYVILESLSGLGLVSQITKGKKTYFIAESPESLRRLLAKKEDELKEQQAGFESILPVLNSLKNLPPESPGVKFYDSVEGIRALLASFLSSHSKEPNAKMGYGFSNTDQLFEFFPEIKENRSNPDRIKAGVPSRIIYTSSQGKIYQDTDNERNRESRYVPSDKFPLEGDITIFGNHIVMLSFATGRPIGVTIESAALANGMRAIFDLAWESAEKYNK